MFILDWLGIVTAFYRIAIWIVSGIYKVAAWVFEIFLILSSGTLLDESAYRTIIENFYVVLGIIMLFILAFGLLKGMINPDDQKQGTSTVKKVITNLITSSIIMALLPTIFSYAYSFQTSFITDYNVIGKFFGYGNIDSDNDNPTQGENFTKAQQGAYQIVNGVFTAFFNVDSDNCRSEYNISVTNSDTLISCQNTLPSADEKNFNDGNGETDHSFLETMAHVEKNGTFGVYTSFAENVADDEIDFNFLLSVIAGIILLFIGVSYCFDMALRLVKLVFYQLIAPIPIFFRVIPEGKLSGTFNQWVKATITCYLEVFIRIFIFYFCIYLCKEMMNSTFISDVFNYGAFIGLLAKAFVLMGIIMFMRQAPKLFSEITGIDSGNMKLGIRDKMAGAGLFTAGAVVGGGITALSKNAFARGGQAVNKWKEVKGTTGKEKRKAVLGALGASVGVLGSTIGGTVSGATRSGKAGKGAKSFKDMKASASSGAAAAVSARDKREKYKADHGNKILPFEKDADGKLHFAKDGVLYGHVSDKWKDVKRWATDGVYEQFSQEKSLYSSIASDAKSMKNTSENLIRGKMHMFTMSDKTGTGFELKDAAGNLIKSSTGEAIKFGASASLEQVEKVVDALKATGKIEDAKIAAQLNGELQQRIKAVAKEFRDTATTKNYTAFNNSFMATSEMIEDKAMVELQDVASNFETLQEKYNANISLEGIKSFQTQKGTLDAKNVTDLADHLEVQMAQIDAKIRKEEAAGRGGKK